MPDNTQDLQSLITLRRRSGEFQRLLDIAAQADAQEGIRQGIDDVKEGRVRPAREFFSDFEKRHDARRGFQHSDIG